MIDIIVTADYEIFGNGTGDVRNCLIRPTDDLLNICDQFGAKVTLFFEIVEYWAFKNALAEGKLKHLGYSPSKLMETQAKKTIEDGHDVQLHLHPQWLDNEYTENGWRVNFDYWRLPKVPHGLGDLDDVLSLKGLLFKGKHDLEKMLMPLSPNYECVALRAGDHCIQPARDVIQAMKEVGLLADSSVFKGGYFMEEPFDVDFRDGYSESKPWWADPEDINMALENGDNTILEFPIYTLKRREIGKLNLQKVLQWARRRNARHPPNCMGDKAFSMKKRYSLKTPFAFFAHLFQPVATRWDYCSLTSHELWRFLKRALKKTQSTSVYSPLVMIGHPKAFVNHYEFRNFLKKVTQSPLFRSGELRFSTMRQAVRKVFEAGD